MYDQIKETIIRNLNWKASARGAEPQALGLIPIGVECLQPDIFFPVWTFFFSLGPSGSDSIQYLNTISKKKHCWEPIADLNLYSILDSKNLTEYCTVLLHDFFEWILCLQNCVVFLYYHFYGRCDPCCWDKKFNNNKWQYLVGWLNILMQTNNHTYFKLYLHVGSFLCI